MANKPFQTGDIIEFGHKRRVRGEVIKSNWFIDDFIYRVKSMPKDGSQGKVHKVTREMNPVLIKAAPEGSPNDGKIDYSEQCQSRKQCDNE